MAFEDIDAFLNNSSEDNLTSSIDSFLSTPEKKPKPQPSLAADVGRLALQGVSNVGGTVGYGLEKTGIAPEFGRKLQESDIANTQRLNANLSEAQQQANAQPFINPNYAPGTEGGSSFINPEFGFRSLVGNVVPSIPGTLAMGVLGSPLASAATKGLSLAGVGAKTAQTVGSGLGFGASEGAFSGAQNAEQWGAEQRAKPIEAFANSPAFQQALAELGDPEKAKESVINKGQSDIFNETLVKTGGISALTGGGAFGVLRGSDAADSAIKATLKGIGSEAAQEAPQSYFEQVATNKATQQQVDPTQDPYEGALNAGIVGGIAGGVMGAAGGIGPLSKAAMNAALERSQNERTNQNIPNTGQPVQPAATQPQAPADVGPVGGNRATNNQTTTGTINEIEPENRSPATDRGSPERGDQPITGEGGLAGEQAAPKTQDGIPNAQPEPTDSTGGITQLIQDKIEENPRAKPKEIIDEVSNQVDFETKKQSALDRWNAAFNNVQDDKAKKVLANDIKLFDTATPENLDKKIEKASARANKYGVTIPEETNEAQRDTQVNEQLPESDQNNPNRTASALLPGTRAPLADDLTTERPNDSNTERYQDRNTGIRAADNFPANENQGDGNGILQPNEGNDIRTRVSDGADLGRDLQTTKPTSAEGLTDESTKEESTKDAVNADEEGREGLLEFKPTHTDQYDNEPVMKVGDNLYINQAQFEDRKQGKEVVPFEYQPDEVAEVTSEQKETQAQDQTTEGRAGIPGSTDTGRYDATQDRGTSKFPDRLPESKQGADKSGVSGADSGVGALNKKAYKLKDKYKSSFELGMNAGAQLVVLDPNANPESVAIKSGITNKTELKHFIDGFDLGKRYINEYAAGDDLIESATKKGDINQVDREPDNYLSDAELIQRKINQNTPKFTTEQIESGEAQKVMDDYIQSIAPEKEKLEQLRRQEQDTLAPSEAQAEPVRAPIELAKTGKPFSTEKVAKAALQSSAYPQTEATHEVVPVKGGYGLQEKELQKGTVGGKVSTGQILLTSSGRKTTPFPEFSNKQGITQQKHIDAVDKWLLQNAYNEAVSKGDEFNAIQFKGDIDAKSIPQASKDSAEEYLFGRQPEVPKPLLKPLTKPVTATTEKPVTGQQPVKTQVTPKQTQAAKKLREIAQTTLEVAKQEQGKDRLTNTAKRAREAGYSIEKAMKQEALAKTMMNIADAHERGETKALSQVTNKTQIETLDTMVRRAVLARQRNQNMSYSEQQKEEGRPASKDDISFIKYPEIEIHETNLLSARNKLSQIRGGKQLARELNSRFLSQDQFNKIKKVVKDDKKLDDILGWYPISAAKEQTRLKMMGINNQKDLVNAAKEYIQFKEGKKEEDQAIKLERGLVGQNLGNDYFPTPKTLAQRMAELAEVKEGSRVLEPSAGNGNLADAAKAKGAKVDTVEISPTLQDVLKAKGHNLVGTDFNEYKPTEQYDSVIMNPPFSKNQDSDHIQKAYDMVKPGGKLVAIAGEGVFFRNDKKSQTFRDWLDQTGATVEKLPQGTFQDKTLQNTTGANARLITIQKPQGQLQSEYGKSELGGPISGTQLNTQATENKGSGVVSESGLNEKNDWDALPSKERYNIIRGYYNGNTASRLQGKAWDQFSESDKTTAKRALESKPMLVKALANGIVKPEEFPTKEVESAFAHTSNHSGDAALVYRNEFLEGVQKEYEDALPFAETPEQKATLKSAIDTFKTDWVNNLKPVLSARSNTYSALRAGGSNFNSKQASRRNSSADKQESSFSKWLSNARGQVKQAVLNARNQEQLDAESQAKVDKVAKRESQLENTIKSIHDFKPGDNVKFGIYNISKVTKDKQGYPSAVIVDATDLTDNKFDLARTLFKGDKAKLHAIVDKIRSEPAQNPPESIQVSNDMYKKGEKVSTLKSVQDSDDLLSAISKLGGLNQDEAVSQGIDPAALGKRGAKILRVFSKKNAKSYDEMAEALRGYNFDVQDANDLVDKVSRAINQGEKFYNPVGYEKLAELKSQERLNDEEAQFASELETLLNLSKQVDDDYYQTITKLIESGRITPDNITEFEDEINELIPGTDQQSIKYSIKETKAFQQQDIFGGKTDEEQQLADRKRQLEEKRNGLKTKDNGGGELFIGYPELYGQEKLSKSAPQLYSQLRKSIESAPDRVFSTGPQTKAWLTSNAPKLNVKKDEIYWSGIEDFLDAQGKVSKQDVLSYLDENGVKTDDVKSMDMDDIEKMLSASLNNEDTSAFGFAPKHNNLTLTLPGGKDYRETVVTIPSVEKFNESDSTHFGDVGTGKQIAWTRSNVRTDASGKDSLFLEEVQSQRGQEGRKKGFQDKRKKTDDQIEFDIVYEDKQLGKIPPSPFVTDSNNKATNAYISLLLKKSVLQAIENGQDSVSWTTGTQQAERYDLSRQISRVRYDNMNNLKAYDLNDRLVLHEQIPEEKVQDYIGKEPAEKLLKTKAEDGVREISGIDLKLGGEWADSMYGDEQGLDRNGKPSLILQAARDIAKRFGGKVGSVDLNTGTQPALIITPEMKAKVTGEGLPLFSKEKAKTGSTVAELKGMLNAQDKKLVQSGKLKLAQSKTDIPKGLISIDANGVEGFYNPRSKSIYVIADNVTKDNFFSVLHHEYLHASLAENPKLKDRLMGAHSELRDIFSKVESGEYTGKYKSLYNEALRRTDRAKTPDADRFEEWLAYQITQWQKSPSSLPQRLAKAIKDLVAAIKALIYRYTGQIGQISPADLVALARSSMSVDKMKGQNYSQQKEGVLMSEKLEYDKTEDEIKENLAKILDKAESKKISHFGVRSMSPDPKRKKPYKVGDKIKSSRNLNNYDDDSDYLHGASSFRFDYDGYDIENIDYALTRSKGFQENGEQVVLIGGTDSYEGQMTKERVIINPVILHIFSKDELNVLTNGEFSPESNDTKYSMADDLREFKERAGLGPKRTLTQTISDILSRGVSGNTQLIKDKWEEVKPQIEQGVFDKFLGIKLAEKEILGDVAHSLSGYIGARLSTGSSSTMSAIIQYGAPEWKNGIIQKKAGSKGFADIIKPVADDMENFTAWMVARRSDRLFREGKENNFTREMIDAGLSLFKPKYQTVADDIAALNSSILDLAQDAGLIEPAARTLFENTDYIPFFRIVEGKTKGPRNKQGLSHQTSGIRMLKGGENPMSDPLGNLMQNWAHLVDASMKNSALDKTLKNLDGSRFITSVPRVEFKSALIPKEQIKKLMIDSGLPKQIVDAMPSEITQGIAKMWAMQAPTDPDIVRVMRGGKSDYFRVNDGMLLTSLVAVNQTPLNGAFKYMRAFKSLLTGAVTADPTFMARNFIRDSMQSWTIAEEKGFKFGVDSIKGAIKTFKEDNDFIDMMFAGASFQGGYGNYNNPDAARKSMDAALRKKGIKDVNGFMDSVLDTPKKYWEAYRSIGDAIENANRDAILENAKRAGKEKAEYLFEAKDLMDFSMHGSFVLFRALNDMLPFFNARLEGLYRLVKAGKTQEAKKLILMKGASIAMMSLALLAINSDNDDYEALEDWDKDQYFHFFFVNQHFRIPKPFELGLVFGTIPERSARLLIGKDTLKEFASRMGHGASDTLAFNPIPQMFRPFMEVYANTDMFTGRPIENMSDEGKLPSARYNANTSETMRLLSSLLPEALGASPKRLEHLMHGYTGAMGMYLLGTSDILVNAASGGPSEPTMRMDRIPVLKAFYQQTPAMHTKYGTQFYDMLREVEQVNRTINAYKKEGRIEEAKKLQEENADKLKVRKQLTKANKSLSEVRKTIDFIHRSNLSPDQKRTKIDRLMEQSNEKIQDLVKRTHPYFN